MSERAKELADQFVRYLGEAAAEWADSFRDSPPSHAYTALFGIAGYQIIRWTL